MPARAWLLVGVLIAALLLWRREDVAVVIDKARQLIAGEEGLRLEAYPDDSGKWTIGWGHLIKPGEKYFPFGPVKVITREQADALFASDKLQAAHAVANNVHVPITDNQRAALESLAFNIGTGNFASSTLVRKLNAGDVQGAWTEFPKWNKIEKNGTLVVDDILVARRAREAEIFLT